MGVIIGVASYGALGHVLLLELGHVHQFGNFCLHISLFPVLGSEHHAFSPFQPQVHRLTVKVATDNCLETELPDRRPRKVSRRLDSSAEKTEVTFSAMEKLKREMTEAVDMALSELNARFFW